MNKKPLFSSIRMDWKTPKGLTFEIDGKVWFEGEKRSYTIRAVTSRFLICTKKFAARKTFIYTIVDWRRGVRGPCDLVLGLMHDLENPKEVLKALEWLENGKMEVSRRHEAQFTITKYLPPND